jgi:hypothetical protein
MGKSAGLSPSVTSGITANADALTAIAQTQSNNSNQLFQESQPGFQQAESFEGSLASGDPYKIAAAISPATQKISQATAGAKANIMNNAPSGGEKNLALEQADVSQGAQVGGTATNAYLNSFNSLAQLASQGIGESTSAAGTGISGFGAANQGLSQVGQLQIEQKGAQLGALSSFGGDLAKVGAGFIP